MRIFVYFCTAYVKTIIIDPMEPQVNTSMKTETNWLKSSYDNNKQKEILANTPKTLGYIMSANVFVDASHAGYNLKYLPHTGILIYVNNTLDYQFYKRQQTVETYTFGAE